jgi:RHS repeat-associated protein
LKATYTYDVFNRRVQEDKWLTGSGTTTVRLAYDSDGTVLADLDGSNTLQTRYWYRPGAVAPVSRIASGSTTWLLEDHLGSVRNSTNGTGALTGTVVYDGVGKITTETNATATGRYAYTGLFQDRDEKLVFAGQRVYDLLTSRWVQQDPIQFTAGDANLYRYVGNNSTNKTDPSGLDSGDNWVRNLLLQYNPEDYFTFVKNNPLIMGGIRSNYPQLADAIMGADNLQAFLKTMAGSPNPFMAQYARMRLAQLAWYNSMVGLGDQAGFPDIPVIAKNEGQEIPLRDSKIDLGDNRYIHVTAFRGFEGTVGKVNIDDGIRIQLTSNSAAVLQKVHFLQFTRREYMGNPGRGPLDIKVLDPSGKLTTSIFVKPDGDFRVDSYDQNSAWFDTAGVVSRGKKGDEWEFSLFDEPGFFKRGREERFVGRLYIVYNGKPIYYVFWERVAKKADGWELPKYDVTSSGQIPGNIPPGFAEEHWKAPEWFWGYNSINMRDSDKLYTKNPLIRPR